MGHLWCGQIGLFQAMIIKTKMTLISRNFSN